jgi:NTE family protein
MYDALVLSGGGINGIAHVGCLAALGDDDVLEKIDTVAGTSAGSLIAAMWCLGLDMREVFRTVYLMDRTRLGSVSLGNATTSFGIDGGEGLSTLIETFVPPTATFADVLRDRGKTLLITATCLTDETSVTFGPATHPHMPISLAVRMSCSIPLVFAGVRYENKVYVDGSVLNNFPIDVVPSKKRVLGITVSRLHQRVEGLVIETLADFVGALAGTLVATAHQTKVAKNLAAVIDVRSAVPAFTLFDVTDTQLAYLYNLGFVKGRDFRRKIA